MPKVKNEEKLGKVIYRVLLSVPHKGKQQYEFYTIMDMYEELGESVLGIKAKTLYARGITQRDYISKDKSVSISRYRVVSRLEKI